MCVCVFWLDVVVVRQSKLCRCLFFRITSRKRNKSVIHLIGLSHHLRKRRMGQDDEMMAVNAATQTHSQTPLTDTHTMTPAFSLSLSFSFSDTHTHRLELSQMVLGLLS